MRFLIADTFTDSLARLTGDEQKIHYVREPFERSGITTDFNGASMNFHFAGLLKRATESQ